MSEKIVTAPDYNKLHQIFYYHGILEAYKFGVTMDSSGLLTGVNGNPQKRFNLVAHRSTSHVAEHATSHVAAHANRAPAVRQPKTRESESEQA